MANPINPVNPIGYLLNELKAAFTPAPIEQHTETYSNGDTYRGGWRNNKREGTGALTCVNGELYVGEWKNDKRHGKGRRKWFVEEDEDEPSSLNATRNCDWYIYDGQWKDDQRHGEGMEMWYHTREDWGTGWNNDEGSAPINTWIHDGYTGQWKKDSKNGMGKSIYHYVRAKVTRIYEGKWKNNKRHGHGKEATIYANDNEKNYDRDGEWENDVLRQEVEYMSRDERLYGRGGRG